MISRSVVAKHSSRSCVLTASALRYCNKMRMERNWNYKIIFLKSPYSNRVQTLYLNASKRRQLTSNDLKQSESLWEEITLRTSRWQKSAWLRTADTQTNTATCDQRSGEAGEDEVYHIISISWQLFISEIWWFWSFQISWMATCWEQLQALLTHLWTFISKTDLIIVALFCLWAEWQISGTMMRFKGC